MVFVIEPGELPAGDDGCLEIALVNNMPDAALRQTELQFVRLLDAGSSGAEVRLRRYTLPEIARSGIAADHARMHYFPLDALWDSHPGGVIVTGCEPLSDDLTAEPYWNQLSAVLTWARGRVPSTIASCLAAHAALLAFDGVQRDRLPDKRSGAYSQEVAEGNALTAGLPSRVVMPHSRLNDVPSAQLLEHGYQLLISSDDAGWTAAVQEFPGHQLVLLQGHPEYDADTLLLEFRRDVRRYVSGERRSFPEPPEGYFPAEAAAMIGELAASAEAAGRYRRGVANFPLARLRSLVEAPWQQSAERLYANWLAEVRRRTTAPIEV